MPSQKEFLNPNSMLTPGFAGAITTGIAMPLAINFDLKIKWVAILISFMFALLLALKVKEEMPRIQKTIYCALNTLIIFSISAGASINLDPPPTFTMQPLDPELQKLIESLRNTNSMNDVNKFSIMRSAQAQEQEQEQDKKENGNSGNEKANTDKQKEPNLKKKELRKLQEYMRQQEKQEEKQRKYNKRWSW